MKSFGVPRPADWLTSATWPPRGAAAASAACPAQAAVSQRVLLFPLWFFQLYLLGSLLAFAFGPVESYVANPLKLYGYALAGQLAIWIGYRWGLAQGAAGYNGPLTKSGVLKAAILATIIIAPATVMNRSNTSFTIVESITNPGAAYAAHLQDLQDREQAPYWAIAKALSGPLLGLFMPLGVIYLNRAAQGGRYCGRLAWHSS